MNSWSHRPAHARARHAAHLDTFSIKHGEREERVTVHVFLCDAVGPDEGGQAADVPLEDALVDRELAFTGQDDRVLVIVVDNGVA